MSPVHVRGLRVTKRRLLADDDEIVWVGPGSNSLTELASLGRPSGETITLLATARDVTHFGLVELPIAEKPEELRDPVWRGYPNGLDPAPVAIAHLCGTAHALFAVPSHDKPHAPQDLRVAPVGSVALGGEEVLAHSRAFNDVSVAPLKAGALLSWTADYRTWAMVVGCPSAP
jgi:hypothetical protein